ncbi:histidine kinase dimerization/phospho-acceptor domain-containing protein, partial [Pantoea sp. SIMBA_072]
PVDETDVPLEIRPLTSAMNALLGRLKTALDAQRKFIADAAHELRTPIMGLSIQSQLLRRAVELQYLAGFVGNAYHVFQLHVAAFNGGLDHGA